MANSRQISQGADVRCAVASTAQAVYSFFFQVLNASLSVINCALPCPRGRPEHRLPINALINTPAYRLRQDCWAPSPGDGVLWRHPPRLLHSVLARISASSLFIHLWHSLRPAAFGSRVSFSKLPITCNVKCNWCRFENSPWSFLVAVFSQASMDSFHEWAF